MTNQDFAGHSEAENSGRSNINFEDVTQAATETLASVSRATRDAGSKVREAASDTAATVSDHFKVLLDKQISGSIGAAGLFAGAVKRAAAEFDTDSPIAANIVRTVADRVEQFAEEYEDETVEQLTRSASDFTRQQPILVFGVAAIAGFLICRAIASAPSGTTASDLRPADTGLSHG